MAATTTGDGSATFTYTAPPTAGAVTATSGSGQSAARGQAFPAPLVATVTDPTQDGAPVAGAAVTFTVTSGAATFPGVSTTDTGLTASVPLDIRPGHRLKLGLIAPGATTTPSTVQLLGAPDVVRTGGTLTGGTYPRPSSPAAGSSPPCLSPSSTRSPGFLGP